MSSPTPPLFERKDPHTNVKPPYWRLSGDGSKSGKWLDILGFMDFRPVLFFTKCHTENSSQISHLCRLFFWKYSFSRHQDSGPQMRVGRNSDSKTESFAFFESSRFVTMEQRMLTQNCVCFTNLCISSFVPTFVTRKNHSNVLERLHLLQYISVHLQKTLPWASGYIIPQSF